ncbi:MAG: tRNA (adenosine(37)-N6)-dimethylallyltransferase MiaA [Verrucomicrobia bacterium]|nr:tRNA (adenosine(37)-N6)-dimethylallyltransferase MiaA [Verrucomicrobiota bacterium]
MLPAFYVVGPTASGKTELALALAEAWDAEIVSADAYQLYAGLDLLGAKPEPSELARIRHHLIGTVPLGEPMHAVRYRELAVAALADIHARGRRAIVCGGSGLYVKALTHGFDAGASPDPARRAAWAQRPLAELVDQLRARDPAAAERIDLRNPRRVLRALEIATDGGSARAAWEPNAEPPAPVGVFLQWERAELHARIAARTRRMFERGVLAEVAAARAAGLGPTAAQMIGWAECCACLDGQLAPAAAEERIAIATRQYAKRQHTWFKREPIFQPLPVTCESGLRAALETASSLMRRILPLFLGLAAAASVCAQETKPSAPTASAPAASASAPQAGPDAAKSGQLVFEKNLLKQKADAGATTVTYKFPFTVKGTDKVTLFSTETDCGCTAAPLEKQIYQPGEKGEITVNFRIGDLVGTQLKKIRLRASDQSEPHVLTIETTIPVFAKVTPQFVVWEHRSEKSPKSFNFELGPENQPIEGLTVTSNVPSMSAVVKEIEKGRKFEIVVTPATTDTFVLATFDIAAKLPAGQSGARTMKAYATVKPAPVGEQPVAAAPAPAAAPPAQPAK